MVAIKTVSIEQDTAVDTGAIKLKGDKKAPSKTWFPPFEYANLLNDPNFGDWRDELVTKSYVVIKEAIPRERALEYRDKFHSWMTSFGLGYDRNDPSTYKAEHLPVNIKGGMFHNYAIGHEQFVWDIRAEPRVVDAFAKVWGTEELITSFDGGCVMLPNRQDVTDGGKWEHTDQSPRRFGFYCVQGIVNLNECGAKDGGLMVLEGSAQLFEEYFNVVGREEVRTWGPVDWYGFSIEEQQWFFDRGCVWKKVEAGPGDLILWDSRALHYNVRPIGTRDRVCTYVCMAPAKLASEADVELRKNAFLNYRGTTHVPFASIHSRAHQPVTRAETGLPDPLDTGVPQQPVQLTDRIAKLASVKPY